MRRVLPFLLLLTGSLSHGQTQAVPINGQALTGVNERYHLDDHVLSLMSEYGLPGATLTVMAGDRIVLAKGYGWADRDAQVEMQPDALFRVPYLDRVITAAATLRLIEQGALTMNTQVFPLLNDLPPLEGATVDPRQADIVIQHLLEDTSGFGAMEESTPFPELVREYSKEIGLPSPISCENIIRVVRGKTLPAAPGGAASKKSDIDYCILAAIIERLSGMSYEDYVRKYVFGPLGITTPMAARTFRKDQPPREVRYYTESPDLVVSVFDQGPAMVPAPYGGFPWESRKDAWVISSVDYSRIIASLAGYGPRILASGSTTSVTYTPPYKSGSIWYLYGHETATLVTTFTLDSYTSTLFLNLVPPHPDEVIQSLVSKLNLTSNPMLPSGSLTSQFLNPPAVPQAAIQISSDITGTQPINSFGTLVLPTAGPATVTLDGRSSMPGTGSITGWQWRVNGDVIGNTAHLTYDLTAPNNSITLRVTDSSGRQQAVSATVTLAGNVPFISSVNAAGGGDTIAANTWIEIKGLNLAPAAVPDAGITWSKAPEFAQGRMPTSLANVSVTVNGKPAYTYFVSKKQVNVLTGLMPASGNVDIVVTTAEGSSDAFSSPYASLAPAFFQIGSGNIAATHLDGSLIGPADLFPGYTTGIAQGETIVLYANGFGPPGTMLVEGSSTQTGTLPQFPTINFNGTPGEVGFAGLIAPGLYQFNVTPPSGLSGSVEVIADYQGAMTPSGAMLYFSETQ